MEFLYMLVGAALLVVGFIVGKQAKEPEKEQPPENTPVVDESIKRQIENWYSYDGRRQE